MVFAMFEADARKDLAEKMYNQIREELRKQVGTLTGAT